MKKRKLYFVALYILFFSLPGSEILVANVSPKNDNTEFDIFKENNNATSETNKNERLNNSEKFQINLTLLKQFTRDSLFVPNNDFAQIDSWVFIQLIRFTDSYRPASFWGINFDLGLFNTTNTKTAILNTINSSPVVSNAINNIDSMFSQEVSLLHFYVYDFSVNYSLFLSESDTIFISLGIMPLKQGNSFFRNPVSFFDRYFPPTNYIQEYSPKSLPGLKLEYVRNIYHGELLFVPKFTPKDETSKKLYDYMFMLNPGNVFMFKNDFDFPNISLNLYMFWENIPSDSENYFALGSELVFRITDMVNISGQFLVSDGIKKYNTKMSGNIYEFNSIYNSQNTYKLVSFLSLNYSGFKNLELFTGYFYNGFALSKSEYNSSLEGLKWAKSNYIATDITLLTASRIYYAGFFGQYDLFSLNQHYLYLSLVHIPDQEIFSWGISVFVTVEKFSLLPVIFFNINLNNHAKIIVQGTALAGEVGSVFAESPLAGSVNAGLEYTF